MGLRDWLPPRKALLSPTDSGGDTDPHRSAQDGTGLPPVGTNGATDADQSSPLIFGALRSAREHAIRLRDCLAEELGDRSVYVGDLEIFHERMCDQLGWTR